METFSKKSKHLHYESPFHNYKKVIKYILEEGELNMMNLFALVFSVVVGIGFVKLVNSIDEDYKGYYNDEK